MMFVGIRENKVFDITSDLRNKRTILDDKPVPPDSVKYIEFVDTDFFQLDICIDDTWNYELNDSYKDSPERFKEPEKSEIQILQEQVQDLQERVSRLEGG